MAVNNFSGTTVNSLFAAGKNKILNGDFSIWQRGTTTTPASGFGFGPDRWQTFSYAASASTISQQSFTPGTAPVAGYESAYFCRILSTNTNKYISTRIEDVRTFAGQTVTLSFWTKSATARTGVAAFVTQSFGAGGSDAVSIPIMTSQTSGTTWSRLTATATIPSIAGKTIGAGSYLELVIQTPTVNNAFDIWGVQLEAGSVATPFTTATGNPASELAACQRYYVRWGGEALYTPLGTGVAASSTVAYISVVMPVEMRIAPTAIDYSGIAVSEVLAAFTAATPTLTPNFVGKKTVIIEATVTSGLTTNRPMFMSVNFNLSGYLGFSAEL